jgi:hypothetical protein
VDQFLTEAHTTVGDQVFEAEVRAGRELDLVGIAELAGDVLSAAADPENRTM